MDYAELLFALKMREHVLNEMSRQFPEGMSDFRRKEFIADNYEGFLLDALDEVQRTAYLIKDAQRT